MARNLPDDRLIYLALKNIFAGQDALLRHTKKIRRLIQNHQDHPEIRSLIAEHNLDNVCNAARRLLEQKVFESTLNAKIRFPEVFDVSPMQSAERAVSEAEAAQHEDIAIKDLADGCHSTFEEQDNHHDALADKGTATTTLSKNVSNHLTSAQRPSLYPVYLPYSAQHKLLCCVQEELEKSCYKFAQQRMVEILNKENWTCAQSVELNIWAKLFSRHKERFLELALQNSARPFRELLESAAQLRHTAVHRLPVTVNRVERFLSDAEVLLGILEDDASVKELSRLRREFSTTVGELKRNKDLLESRLADNLKRLANKRAALDRQEASAIENMLKEDKEYREIAGFHLQQAIAYPSTAVPSTASVADETGSEIDFDEPGPSAPGPEGYSGYELDHAD